MIDDDSLHPELDLALALLEKIDVPQCVERAFEHHGQMHNIAIKRIGVNPAMTLQVIREWGVDGIKHSAPTCFFWKCSGAPSDILDAFNQAHGDKLFDFVQQAMISPDHANSSDATRYH